MPPGTFARSGCGSRSPATDFARGRAAARRVTGSVPALHPFLDAPTPIVVAHRGASGEAPENTLEAFAIAVDQGCTYLETDAHVTRAGVVVASHAHRLDRATDRRGTIEALTIAEVEQADAGYH